MDISSDGYCGMTYGPAAAQSDDPMLLPLFWDEISIDYHQPLDTFWDGDSGW